MEGNKLKWVLLLLLGSVWGSSFILMQLGLKGLTPIQLGALRILFAGCFLLLIGFKQLAKIPRYKWKFIGITALCGTFFPVFLFATALTKIDGSVSSILNSLTPISTLLVGMFVFGISVQRRQILGVFLGFVGCALLVLFGEAESNTENYYYAFLILIASFLYGINANFIKTYLSDLNPLAISVGNFTLMFVPALIILFSTGFFEVVQHTEVTDSMKFVAILGIVGTGLSNILFFKLIQVSSPVFASSVTYIIPVVASLLGFAFMNEALSLVQTLGAFVVLIGVYFSSRK